MGPGLSSRVWCRLDFSVLLFTWLFWEVIDFSVISNVQKIFNSKTQSTHICPFIQKTPVCFTSNKDTLQGTQHISPKWASWDELIVIQPQAHFSFYQLPQLYGIVFFLSDLVFFLFFFFFWNHDWDLPSIQIPDGFKASDEHVTWAAFPGGFFHWGRCQLSLSIHVVACISPTFF